MGSWLGRWSGVDLLGVVLPCDPSPGYGFSSGVRLVRGGSALKPKA